MKKFLIYYTIGVLAVIALFNVIVFVPPIEVDGHSRLNTQFWIGYAFITVCFLAHLGCAFIAFGRSLKTTFYHLAFIRTSVTTLIISFAAGAICLALDPLPVWISIIFVSIATVICIIMLLKSMAIASVVSNIDDQVKFQTGFIRYLTADASSLLAGVQDPAIRPICQKVYEAIRYSDPMSVRELANVENAIGASFADFSMAARNGDAYRAESVGNYLLSLIADRNSKCKMLK